MTHFYAKQCFEHIHFCSNSNFCFFFFLFSTIWHELIFGFLPFEGKPAEVVIWQVGKGIKQSLINLQASKEIKVFIVPHLKGLLL